MKVLITGGHFSPAYSLIKELISRGATVAIAGRKYTFEGDETLSLEYEIAKSEKIKFFEVKTGRLQRRFSPKTAPSIIRIFKGFGMSSSIFSEFKPDVVLTFGGYVAFPIVYRAFLKKIPIILHEQTPKAGLAARLISHVAAKICISFESSRAFFPDNKTVFTGIPIREEVFKVKNELPLPKDKKVIYITGGSSGSHFINNLIAQKLALLTKNYVVIHQSGDSREFTDYHKLLMAKETLPEKQKENYILKKFIYPDQIGFVYKNADIVISRAGINTVVELLALGKPCFLIPLPHGQHDEQLNNAKLIEESGIGKYMEERYITSNRLYDEVVEMLSNVKSYEKNKNVAAHYIVTDAVGRIMKVVEGVYDIKKEK